MFHPRAHVTELDERGFRTHDLLGRRVHEVAWDEVVRLTVFHKDAWLWMTTVVVVAWRCEPRRPGSGRRRWVRGGRNFLGEEIDGALPDPYDGAEPTVRLFASHVRAGAGAPIPGLSAGVGS
jgi:hypothetical protein